MSPRVQAIGAIIVSFALLASGLYVLLWDIGEESLQKYASGWVGLVAGFWLK